MHIRNLFSFTFNKKKFHLPLEDTNQNWWQLGSIQSSGAASLPVFLIGALLSNTYGTYSALLCIFIGNLILTIINLIVILLGYPKKQSIFELARDYIGYFGAMIIGASLVIAVLSWIPIQLDLAKSEILKIPNTQDYLCEKDCLINLPVSLGIITSFIVCFGMRGIRWFSVCSMPFILLFFVIVFWNLDFSVYQKTSVSLAGLPLVIGASLTRTTGLPSFFRHSHNLKHAMIGASIYQVVVFFTEVLGVFFTKTNESLMSQLYYVSPYLIALVVILTTLNANTTNIYAGSVGWEVWIPKVIGKQEYFIIALSGITTYMLVYSKTFFYHIIEYCDIFLGSLGGVFIACFVFGQVTKNTTSKKEIVTHFIFWMFGIFLGCASQMNKDLFSNYSRITAFLGSLFSLSLFFYFRKIVRQFHFRR